MLRDPFATPRQSPLVSAAVVGAIAVLVAVNVGVLGGPLHATIGIALLAALSAWLLLRLVGKIGVSPERANWLAAAALFGTGVLFAQREALSGPGRAALLALPVLLLALSEAYGRGRPWVCGLLLALAFALRPYSLACAPFLLVALLAQKPGSRERVLRSTGVFIACTAVGLIALLLAPRWHSGEAVGAIDQLFANNPTALTVLNRAFELLGMPSASLGLALPLLSPFVAAAAFADWGRRSAVALWTSLGLSALAQSIGAGLLAVRWRPSVDVVDYLPILLIPIAIAFNQASRTGWIVWRAVVVLSIVACIIGMLTNTDAAALIKLRP